MDSVEQTKNNETASLIDNVIKCFDNKPEDNVVLALEKVIELDLDIVAKDIIDKQAFSGKHAEIFTQEMYDRNIRGMLFERTALRYMEEKGEPEDPYLSNLILDISRNPKGFLSAVYNNMLKDHALETNPSKKYDLFLKTQKLKREIEDLSIPNLPSNSDAIAIKTKGSEKDLKITVVGSIEIKNYHFMKSDTSAKVLEQLEKSKHDTVMILNEVVKYLPYYCKSTGKSNLITYENFDVVAEEDFQQTIVQPNVYKNQDDPDKKFLESQGINIETINIRPYQWAKIAFTVEPEIRKRINKLQKSGYKSKV